MLLIYTDEKAVPESKRMECYEESAQVAHQLTAKGQYLTAAPLYPVATAATVRVRDEKTIVTDGPFAETREQLGGYFLIEANNIDEALQAAAQLPGARLGTVEVRPLIEVASLPPDRAPSGSLSYAAKN